MNNTVPQNNVWFGVSMALMGVIVGYFVASAQGGIVAPSAAPTPPPPPTAAAPTEDPLPPAAQEVVAPNDRDYVAGNPDAEITVIEYSDFECPFCQRHHPTMKQLVQDYGGKVNWIYRHYPLSFHPNAQKAAEASECAGEMGGNEKFWEYADILFEKGPDNTLLADYAVEVGLNRAAFESCLNSGKFAQYVQDSLTEGSNSGINGTPGNIVFNNKTKESELVSGAQPLSSFKASVDRLLN